MDNITLVEISNSIMNILKPIICSGVAALVALIAMYGKKIMKRMEARIELDEFHKNNEISIQIRNEIHKVVQLAVSASMQDVKSLKAQGRKLTDEEATEIHDKVKQAVINGLPNSLTDDNGKLLEILGGKEVLDIAIESEIEACVYDDKRQSTEEKNASKITKSNEAVISMINNLRM